VSRCGGGGTFGLSTTACDVMISGMSLTFSESSDGLGITNSQTNRKISHKELDKSVSFIL
jgi:hypothetical protein